MRILGRVFFFFLYFRHSFHQTDLPVVQNSTVEACSFGYITKDGGCLTIDSEKVQTWLKQQEHGEVLSLEAQEVLSHFGLEIKDDSDYFDYDDEFIPSPSKEEVEYWLTNSGYDKYALPKTVDGNDTRSRIQVNVSLLISSVGSITTSSFVADVFLILEWIDGRLYQVEGIPMNNRTHLQIIGELADHFWHPPVYFQNSKKAEIPDVTVGNKMTVIFKNATMRYIARSIIEVSCSMNFQNYPFDVQNCPIKIAIMGYANHEVELQWSKEQAFYEIEEEASKGQKGVNVQGEAQKMAEFYLEEWGATRTNVSLIRGLKSWVLSADLTLRREIGFYVIQVFVPTILLTIVSWLSFWVDQGAIPARMALCITTVLTLQTISSGLQSKLPAVAYYKALDVWLVVCQAFIFFALLEFVFTHHLKKTKKTSDNVVAPSAPPKEILYNLPQEPKPREDLAEKIDRWCRCLYPPLFIIFNAVYWPVYYFRAR